MAKSIELLQKAFELYNTPKDQQSMLLGIFHLAKSEAYRAGMDWERERQIEHDEELARIETEADMAFENQRQPTMKNILTFIIIVLLAALIQNF